MPLLRPLSPRPRVASHRGDRRSGRLAGTVASGPALRHHLPCSGHLGHGLAPLLASPLAIGRVRPAACCRSCRPRRSPALAAPLPDPIGARAPHRVRPRGCAHAPELPVPVAHTRYGPLAYDMWGPNPPTERLQK